MGNAITLSISQLGSTRTYIITDAVNISIGAFLVVGMLLLFAAGILIHVFLVSHDRKISIRSAMKNAFSALWAVPVLAVVGFFGYRAIAQMESPPPSTRAATPVDSESRQDKPDGAQPEFIPSKTPEAWTQPTTVTTGSEVLTAASGASDVITARGATVADAERKLFEKARGRLRKSISAAHRNDASPANLDLATIATDESIKAHAVRRTSELPGIEKVTFTRPGETESKEYTNDVYQVYWKVDFSPVVVKSIQQDAAVPRVWLIGGFIGLLTLILGSLAAYFRLDTRSEGKYRIRLKLATMSFIVAAGVLMTVLLPKLHG